MLAFHDLEQVLPVLRGHPRVDTRDLVLVDLHPSRLRGAVLMLRTLGVDVRVLFMFICAPCRKGVGEEIKKGGANEHFLCLDDCAR